MRAGQPIHVKIFAAGGLVALKKLAIPGRTAYLVPMVLRFFSGSRCIRRWRYGSLLRLLYRLFSIAGLCAGEAKNGHEGRTGQDCIASGSFRICDSVLPLCLKLYAVNNR